jgi:hypothetical protein
VTEYLQTLKHLLLSLLYLSLIQYQGNYISRKGKVIAVQAVEALTVATG